MTVRERFLELAGREWETVRAEYGVRRIGLFGSCVRGEADPSRGGVCGGTLKSACGTCSPRSASKLLGSTSRPSAWISEPSMR